MFELCSWFKSSYYFQYFGHDLSNNTGLTELIFFGWSVWPATVKKLFFFLPRLLSKDIIAVVLYFIYILHFLHIYPYFRKTSWLCWNIWPLIVVNYLVSEQTQAMQDCLNPWFLGLSSFLWKGVVFINEYCIKNVLLSSSCMLVTSIFHFRWDIEFFLHCYSVWWEPCGIVGTVC